MPTCRMCKNQVDSLVDAHIIPVSFFKEIKGDSDFLYLVSSNPDEYKKRSRIGIYDPDILCLDCERKFGPLDEYGAKILLTKEKFAEVKDPSSGKILAYIIDGHKVDYTKLNKFLLSIVYRGHLSGKDFFKRIRLGPYEDYFYDVIFGKSIHLEPTIFLEYSDLKEIDGISKKTMFDPYITHIDGIKFIKMYLGSGFKAYVKIDKRKMPHPFNLLSLGYQKNIFMVAGGFEKEPDLIKNIVKWQK